MNLLFKKHPQDYSLKIRELEVPAPWFLDPGGWSKTAAVSLYFIFPGICTLSLDLRVNLEEFFHRQIPVKLSLEKNNDFSIDVN
ncbi:hypothetical protein STEG23_028079 [Scotinomys teguina]